MAVVDVSRIKYTLTANLDDGSSLPLTGAVMSLSWGEQDRELAQRASIKLNNVKTDKGYLSSLLKLFTRLRIEANGEEVFSGIVWEWDYTSSLQKELSIVAYDMLIYLQQSKSNTYYPAGQSTKSVVTDLCKDWKIEVNYTYKEIKHAKIVYRNMSIADQIFSLLNECKRQGNERYCAVVKKGVLHITPCGTNADVYVFESNKNVLNTKNSFTCTGMVTKIVISGKADDEGKVMTEAIVELDGEYGPSHIQDIQYRDTDDTIDKATKEAEWTLKERGKPDEEISFEAVDVPFIRKGDKVRIMAGNITGNFYVTAISHNADSRTMSVSIERTKDNPISTKVEEVQSENASAKRSTTQLEMDVKLMENTPVYRDYNGFAEIDTSNFNWDQKVHVTEYPGYRLPYFVTFNGGSGWIAEMSWTEVKK